MPRAEDLAGALSHVVHFPRGRRTPSQEGQGQAEEAAHIRGSPSILQTQYPGPVAIRYLLILIHSHTLRSMRFLSEAFEIHSTCFKHASWTLRTALRASLQKLIHPINIY